MTNNKYLYAIKSGKNNKIIYYIKNYLELLIPKSFYFLRLHKTLEQAKQRNDYAYILDRVNYYNKLNNTVNDFISLDSTTKLSEQKIVAKKVYFFDSYIYTRWFPSNLKWILCPGDITNVPPAPSIVKSRPIGTKNENSIIMKLNKVRHYIFVNDTKQFKNKKDLVLFRGKVGNKKLRRIFLEKYWNNPLCDVGETGSKNRNNQWAVSKMTIDEQLNYKFIMAIEGVDVASNLKWIMSSNSLAVMPLPKYETWFMEGRLIPDYHYIKVNDDFSDLEEKIRYYMSNQEEALTIIKHANEYVKQFMDNKREDIISLMVLEKYFKKTGQNISNI